MVEYAKINESKLAAYKSQWAVDNRDKLNAQQRARLKNDINCSIAHSLRTRLNMALKGKTKAGSVISELGCSIEELKQYLEKQFTEGMDWTNHTNYGWHIDHIIPLSKLDLTDIEQFKKACHYTNLRPMWWRPNIQRNRIVSQE